MRAIRILKVLAVCSALAAAPAMTLAADVSSEQLEQLQKRIDEIKSRVKLSDEQVEQIKPLLQEQATKLRMIKETHSADTSRAGKRSMLQEMKATQKDFKEKLGKVLTPEQMKEWEAIAKEGREKMKERARAKSGA